MELTKTNQLIFSGLVMRLSYVTDKSHAQIQDLKVDALDLKIRSECKINSFMTEVPTICFYLIRTSVINELIAFFALPMFWAILKILKQLLRVFICVSGGFINVDAYSKQVPCFKALIHFHKLQLGKVLFTQQLVSYFFSDFIEFCWFFTCFIGLCLNINDK